MQHHCYGRCGDDDVGDYEGVDHRGVEWYVINSGRKIDTLVDPLK